MKIEIRSLEKIENRRDTRPLYETVFNEDTSSFVDYYYQEKIRNNQIYGLFVEDILVSMVHLNPYLLQFGQKVMMSHYIVAVATLNEYRNKGFMRDLLIHCMLVMANEGEAFTWLMPAHEDIYLPYGFRHIYEQSVYQFVVDDVSKMSEFSFQPLINVDEEIRRTNAILSTYDLFPIRDKAYYRNLMEEVASEGGEIVEIIHQERIIGSFAYALTEYTIEVRNFLITPEYQPYYREIFSVYVKEKAFGRRKVHIAGPIGNLKENEKKTGIMARVLNLGKAIQNLRSEKTQEIIVSITDSIIQGQEGTYIWKMSKEGSFLTKVSDNVISQEVLLIEDMTDLIFKGKLQDKEAKKRVYYPRNSGKKVHSRSITEKMEEFIGNIKNPGKFYFTELV